MRYREASTGENKPRDGQEEARIYIGHGEYIACHAFVQKFYGHDGQLIIQETIYKPSVS